jgi:hypothetical protein
MTIIVRVENPAALLASIKRNIDHKHIATWSYDKDGDFTHTPEQWKWRAWLRPHVEVGQLRFSLMGSKVYPLSKEIYGVYHGRFIEMLLTHFDGDISSIAGTTHQPQYAGA